MLPSEILKRDSSFHLMSIMKGQGSVSFGRSRHHNPRFDTKKCKRK